MWSGFYYSLGSTSTLPILICSLNMTSQILDAIFYVKKLHKESKIPILFIFSSSLKPQAWLFLHLCLLCSSMWWKTETFTSPHFVLSLFFHYSCLISQLSPFLFLPLHGYQEKKPQALLNVLDRGITMTPGCQKEKFWRAFSAWEGLRL